MSSCCDHDRFISYHTTNVQTDISVGIIAVHQELVVIEILEGCLACVLNLEDCSSNRLSQNLVTESEFSD